MLNRHLLRAKALQYMYALHNAKRSNLLLAEDYLDETFSPKFHDSDTVLPSVLEEKRKKSKYFLNRLLEGSEIPSDIDYDIANQARKAKREYLDNCRKDTEKMSRVMMDETLAVYDRFLTVMCFLRDLGEICHQRSEMVGVASEENKERLDFFYLAEPIKKIRESRIISELFIENRIGWQEHQDFIEEFYRTQFRASDTTRKILSSPRIPEKETQIEWVEHVVKELFFLSPACDSFFEDRDSNWQENKSIVKAMVYKTLKRIYESEDDKWQPVAITPDWNEDKIFFENIYRKTNEENDRWEKLLEKYLKNWDLDRVTVVDVIILKMALTEMIHFPSIPIKVTINEFIELAKRYSTPKSKEFVNGILDRMSKDLKEEGLIKKSGRGLLDNS